jgi:hypothetical protein
MDVSLEIELELADDAEVVEAEDFGDAEELEPIEELRPAGVPFLEAGFTHCRTVRGEWRGLAVYCGEPTRKPGESFCAACRKRYFVKPVRFARKRPAIRSALLMATE